MKGYRFATCCNSNFQLKLTKPCKLLLLSMHSITLVARTLLHCEILKTVSEPPIFQVATTTAKTLCVVAKTMLNSAPLRVCATILG